MAAFVDSARAQGGLGRTVPRAGVEVVSNPVDTPALAVVWVEVRGPSLLLQGAVANLAGPFHDYTRDPVDDPVRNTRLTSAIQRLS
ncbi:hypothetical protein [Thermus oshimai]